LPIYILQKYYLRNALNNPFKSLAHFGNFFVETPKTYRVLSKPNKSPRQLDFNVKKRNLKKGLEVADDGEPRE